MPIFPSDKKRKINNKRVDKGIHLKFLNVLKFGRFAVGDARVEETGGDADAQRLAAHPSALFFAVRGDHTERAEQQHKQTLRVDRQRCDDSEKIREYY